MNKKLGILLLAVLLGFAACGTDGKEAGNNDAEPTKATTVTEAPEATATTEPTATPEPEVTEAPKVTEMLYTVTLTELGPEKVKAVRLLWHLNDKADLRGAKDAIENPPCVLYETIHQAAAEKVRADFLATGSKVTVDIEVAEGKELPKEDGRYVITLLEAGPDIMVIKAYREATGLGLKECKDAVESAPCTVIEVTRKKDAELIAATFTEVGATVEITEAE